MAPVIILVLRGRIERVGGECLGRDESNWGKLRRGQGQTVENFQSLEMQLASGKLGRSRAAGVGNDSWCKEHQVR